MKNLEMERDFARSLLSPAELSAKYSLKLHGFRDELH